VTTLAAIQEEVRTVRVLFNKQQSNTFQISAPSAASAAVSIVKPPKQQLSVQKPSAGDVNRDAKSPLTKPKPKPFVRMNSRV